MYNLLLSPTNYKEIQVHVNIVYFWVLCKAFSKILRTRLSSRASTHNASYVLHYICTFWGRSFSIVDSYVVFPCILGILGFCLVSLLGLIVGAPVACGTYGKAYFLFSSGFFFSLSCYSFFQRSFSFGISFAGMRCASSSAFTWSG